MHRWPREIYNFYLLTNLLGCVVLLASLNMVKVDISDDRDDHLEENMVEQAFTSNIPRLSGNFILAGFCYI